jgi:hypothetical protein
MVTDLMFVRDARLGRATVLICNKLTETIVEVDIDISRYSIMHFIPNYHISVAIRKETYHIHVHRIFYKIPLHALKCCFLELSVRTGKGLHKYGHNPLFKHGTHNTSQDFENSDFDRDQICDSLVARELVECRVIILTQVEELSNKDTVLLHGRVNFEYLWVEVQAEAVPLQNPEL